MAQAGTTNLISLQAANNASPGLSATQSFYVTVRPLNSPTVNGIILTNNQMTLTVGGDSGPDYLIQVSTNLILWQDVFTNLSPTPPFNWTDSGATNFTTRFYRILLGP